MKILRKLIIFFGLLFIGLLVLSLVLFAVIRQLKFKEIIEDKIRYSLGINVSIDKLEISPLFTYVGAKGVTIHNPSGFSEDELAYISSLHFVFDPVEVLIKKNPNMYLFALDLKRLNIIKNKEGKVNIKEIIPIKETGASKGENTHFYFAVIVLSVGEVKYIDYTGKDKQEHKYTIGIKDAAFVGLKDEDELVKMVVYKAIQNTDIGKLINLTIVPVVSQIKDTLDAAWGTARGGLKGAFDIATLPFKLLFGKNSF